MTELRRRCCCGEPFEVTVIKGINCNPDCPPVHAGMPPPGMNHQWYDASSLANIPGWPRDAYVSMDGQPTYIGDPLYPAMCFHIHPGSEQITFTDQAEYEQWLIDNNPNPGFPFPAFIAAFPWPTVCTCCFSQPQPPPEYRVAVSCDCPNNPGGGGLNIYVPAQFPIFGDYFRIGPPGNGVCGHFVGGGTVTQDQFQSPFIVGIPEAFFDSCEECCNTLPPPPEGDCLSTDCVGCNDVYAVYVGWMVIQIWSMDAGCFGPIYLPPQLMEITRGGGPSNCNYQGTHQFSVPAPSCAPGELVDITYQVSISCDPSAPGVGGPRHQLVFIIPEVNCTRIMHNTHVRPCPPGAYSHTEEFGLCTDYGVSHQYVAVLP